MNTGTKLKTALVGISIVSALALSSGSAVYASAVRPAISSACTPYMTIESPNYAVASATAGSATCKYSFQYRDEPSGSTGVISANSLLPGTTATLGIKFIDGQQLRTCTNVNGLTTCTTPWKS